MAKYEQYDEYKDSGIEWLGEIPNHWEVVPIKHLAILNPKKSTLSQDLMSDECSFVPMEKLKFNSLVLDDVPKIKVLIQKKSWWDTVDGFHRIIGEVALKYPVMDNMMIQWSLDENLWLRRIAINHQMFRKEKTKVELFEEILSNNLGGDEFFINKAIGWALRDYSKTNPAWVAGFIRKYRDKLSKLSIKEGSKYLSIEILKLMNE